jgi:hypothetical protein
LNTFLENIRIQVKKFLGKIFYSVVLILPSVAAKQSERVSAREHARLDVSDLELIQLQHELLVLLFLVLEPGQVLGGEDKPEVLAAALHDTHTAVQAQVALANHLLSKKKYSILDQQTKI